MIRNPEYYFQLGITFSRTGFYAPTFRLGSKSIFSADGATIFSDFDAHALCGLLNSKLLKYIFKSFIGHTVHTQVDELKQVFILNHDHSELKDLVGNIVENQKVDPKYDYMTNEQIEINHLDEISHSDVCFQ